MELRRGLEPLDEVGLLGNPDIWKRRGAQAYLWYASGYAQFFIYRNIVSKTTGLDRGRLQAHSGTRERVLARGQVKPGRSMKVIDMDVVDLVHSGESWPHKQSPCSRQMLQHLERNEGVVTWVQPKGGTVQDQYPAIRIGEQYYTMSLRMMKAVW